MWLLRAISREKIPSGWSSPTYFTWNCTVDIGIFKETYTYFRYFRGVGWVMVWTPCPQLWIHPCRTVAAYLKVVRRRKPWSAEGTGGGRAREGDYSPLVRGVWGASPEKSFEFWALLCAFLMGFLCVWDQILVVLFTKIFLVAWETECWTKLISDSHMFFFIYSACFFDIISSLSSQVLATYF